MPSFRRLYCIFISIEPPTIAVLTTPSAGHARQLEREYGPLSGSGGPEAPPRMQPVHLLEVVFVHTLQVMV